LGTTQENENHMHIEEPFGPLYPDLGATIAKSRHKARIDPSHRQAHGEAVLAAIRAKQRSELQRELPSRAPNCASGTAHNTGEAILKAIRAQHVARLQAAINADRRRRTDAEIIAEYEFVMEQKRRAERIAA
jgi:hypothetical protein